MAGESAYYDIRIRVFDKPLDDLERKTDRFERKVGGLGNSFLKAFASTAVIAGVGLLAKKIVGLGAEMEQTRVSFTTMLGSADKANATLKELTKFAISTPFRQGEVVTGAKQLLAYGFTAESLTDNLTRLGDVSSGLSIPLGDLVYLYGTVRTQGRAMTKDIMQFANRGIPIYDALNKVTGKYGQELNKAIENGDITFGVIEKAFKMMTKEGSMFGGLMAKQAKTLAGRWSTFLDVLENTGRAMGEKINPFLGRMLDSVSDLLATMKPLTVQYDQQKDLYLNQSIALKSLLPRYEELKSKSKLSASEQGELKDVMSKILDIVPTAATGFDRYGNAIGIATDKIKDFTEYNRDALKMMNASAIKEVSSDLGKMAVNAFQLKSSIEQFRQSAPSAEINKILREKSSELNALMGEGGLLSSKISELRGLGGDISPFAQNFLKKAGYGGYRSGNPFAKSIAKLEEMEAASNAKIAGATGGKTEVGVEKISSATRNVTLNITKLIETLNFTKDPAKNEYDMEEMVKRVLLRAVNDVNIVSQ
jgi:hypothetical protein